jgi:hypothetical protein
MERKQQTPKPKCTYCGTTIRAFSKSFDWDGRPMHQKCNRLVAQTKPPGFLTKAELMADVREWQLKS